MAHGCSGEVGWYVDVSKVFRARKDVLGLWEALYDLARSFVAVYPGELGEHAFRKTCWGKRFGAVCRCRRRITCALDQRAQE